MLNKGTICLIYTYLNIFVDSFVNPVKNQGNRSHNGGFKKGCVSFLSSFDHCTFWNEPRKEVS